MLLREKSRARDMISGVLGIGELVKDGLIIVYGEVYSGIDRSVWNSRLGRI
jgi:hypothetical protein